jgi:tetratricopeptide (TPR) repeat protein
MLVARIILCVLLILQTFRTVAQEVDGTLETDSVEATGYDFIMSKAALALNKEDFDLAHQYYKQAIVLKPGDTYAFKMLKVVENSKWAYAQKQLKDLDLRRKAEINILMRDALKAIMDKKYDTARALYSRVLVLNPVKSQKEFVEQKIKALDQALGGPTLNTVSTPPVVAQITQKTVEQSVKKEPAPVSTSTTKSDNPPAPSNPLNVEKTPAVAPPSQTNQNSKPKEKIDSATTQTSQAKQLATVEAKTGVNKVLDNAAKTIKDSKSVDTAPLDNKVVAANPTKSEAELAKRKADSLDLQIKKAQSKIVEAKEIPAVAEKKVPVTELPKKQAAATTTQPDVRTSSPAASKSAAVPQNNTLVSAPKNNAVRSETPTVGQATTTSTGVNNERIAEISGRILNEKGRLNLSDSIGSVKLTCQQIVVNDKNAFIKFLIQNNSSSESFNPGALQLSYIKNYGVLQKLNGRFVTNATTILPRQDIPMVYVVDAPLEVESNEVFVFEMEEKSKKVRLTINIPGAVYLNEKKATNL